MPCEMPAGQSGAGEGDFAGTWVNGELVADDSAAGAWVNGELLSDDFWVNEEVHEEVQSEGDSAADALGSVMGSFGEAAQAMREAADSRSDRTFEQLGEAESAMGGAQAMLEVAYSNMGEEMGQAHEALQGAANAAAESAHGMVAEGGDEDAMARYLALADAMGSALDSAFSAVGTALNETFTTGEQVFYNIENEMGNIGETTMQNKMVWGDILNDMWMMVESN